MMRRQIGTITKLGKDHYKLRVTAGINPATGKQARKTKTIRGTRKDAEKALVGLIVSVGRGDEVKERLTLDSYWNDVFLPNAEGRLRGRTLIGYKTNYDCMIRDALGGLLIQQITPPVIDQWLTGFDGGRRRFDAYRMLRIILRRAVKDRVVDRAATDFVEIPKYKKHNPKVLSAHEASVYLQSAQGTDMEVMVSILIGSGIRVEELLALTWGDITHDGDVIINKANAFYMGVTYDEGTKSDFSERVIRLPASVRDTMNKHRREDHIHVLSNPDGSPMTYDQMSKRYRAWCKTLPDDVSKVPPRNLRHTSLTLTLEGGADLLSVSRRAGHSNTHITAAYYLRPHKSIDESAAAGLDDLLSS